MCACGHVRTCTDELGHDATGEWACHMPAEWAALGSRHAEMPVHDEGGCPRGEYWRHDGGRACHMPAEWAALGSRHADMPVYDDCECPGGEYWGHKCVAWRWKVRNKMVEHGMDAALCGFVLEDGLGFEPDFGKLVHAWDAKRDKVRWMLSIVDKFVTLLCGSERSTCLVWDPVARVTEPTD